MQFFLLDKADNDIIEEGLGALPSLLLTLKRLK